MRLKASDSDLASVRDHQGLGQAGHAFEDAVAAAEQRDEQFLDDLVLADDDAAQLLLDVVEGVAQPADGFEVFLAQVLGGAGVAVGEALSPDGCWG